MAKGVTPSAMYARYDGTGPEQVMRGLLESGIE